MDKSTHRFHLMLPDRHWQSLSLVSQKTEYSVSEIIRTIIERGLAQEQLDHTYPSLSGTFRTGGK